MSDSSVLPLDHRRVSTQTSKPSLAVHEDVLVHGSRQHIHPTHLGVGEVLQTLLIVVLVVTRH